VATQTKDGSTWRIGTHADVAWIADGTTTGLTITSAIPPVYEAYATVVIPKEPEDRRRRDRVVLALLREHSAGQPWWLGYLDTGSDHSWPWAQRRKESNMGSARSSADGCCIQASIITGSALR